MRDERSLRSARSSPSRVVTAWLRRLPAIVFVAIFVVLLSPKGDQAYIGALAFTVGVAGGVPAAAIVKFAGAARALDRSQPLRRLPGLLASYRSALRIAQSRRPRRCWRVTTAMAAPTFVPSLTPANQMSYDTAQFFITPHWRSSRAALSLRCRFGCRSPLSPGLRVLRSFPCTCSGEPLLRNHEKAETRASAKLLRSFTGFCFNHFRGREVGFDPFAWEQRRSDRMASVLLRLISPSFSRSALFFLPLPEWSGARVDLTRSPRSVWQ